MSFQNKIHPLYPHLSHWIEGDESLIYCSKRNILVHLDNVDTTLFDDWANRAVTSPDKVDSPLIRELLFSSSTAEKDQISLKTELLSWKPLPQQTILSLGIGTWSVNIHCPPSNLTHKLEALLEPLLANHYSDYGENWYLAFDAENRWTIGDEDKIWFDGLRESEVIPLLIDTTQQHAYQSSGYQLAFHGAALSYRDVNILIPGISGAGKTTLASALSVLGATAYSDEVIALDEHYHLQSIPLPFAIKEGSWYLIEEWDSGQDMSDTWMRRDGRKLRYWHPHSSSTVQQAPDRTLIILPEFQKNLDTEISKVSLINTVKTMCQGGYQQQDPYDIDGIPNFLAWIENCECYRIKYGDARLAAKVILNKVNVV